MITAEGTNSVLYNILYSTEFKCSKCRSADVKKGLC